MDDPRNETFHIYIVLDVLKFKIKVPRYRIHGFGYIQNESMDSYIKALSTALRQIYVMVKILFPNRLLGGHLFTYRDYSDPVVTEN
jgi:hypothetical protein